MVDMESLSGSGIALRVTFLDLGLRLRAPNDAASFAAAELVRAVVLLPELGRSHGTLEPSCTAELVFRRALEETADSAGISCTLTICIHVAGQETPIPRGGDQLCGDNESIAPRFEPIAKNTLTNGGARFLVLRAAG